MALSGKDLGDKIAQAITDSGASTEAKAAVKAVWEDIGKAICDYVVANIDVKVPAGSFLTAAQAGVPSTAPVSCTVS